MDFRWQDTPVLRPRGPARGVPETRDSVGLPAQEGRDVQKVVLRTAQNRAIAARRKAQIGLPGRRLQLGGRSRRSRRLGRPRELRLGMAEGLLRLGIGQTAARRAA